MSKQKKIMIVDGNNQLYRAYYRFSHMASSDGLRSGVIYGFLTMLRSLMFKFKPDLVYIIFDGGRSKHRMDLLPNYKNRDKGDDFDKESFFSQRDDLERTLKYLGIRTIREKGYEADDLIHLVAKKFKKEEVIIVSRDKDFNQLVTKNISIWDGHQNIRYTPKNMKGRLGYTPEQCVDWLCLDGDKSDKIPGVPGFGPKTLEKFFEQFGSIKNYLDNPQPFGKAAKNITKEQIKLNRALIDIKYFCKKYLKNDDLSFLDIKVKRNKMNSKRAQAILFKYEIRLMQRNEFTSVFNEYLQQ